MFDRFTTQARAVVVRAQDEARAMGHRTIGTEHLLLGMLDPDSRTVDSSADNITRGTASTGTASSDAASTGTASTGTASSDAVSNDSESTADGVSGRGESATGGASSGDESSAGGVSSGVVSGGGRGVDENVQGGQRSAGASYRSGDRGAAAAVLREAGVRAEEVRQRIRRLVGGAATEIDADALRSIGIDLDVVREQVERTFGPGVLDEPVPIEPKRGFLRRRQGPPTGHIPFSNRAKVVLGLSVREATRLGHNYIGTEHLLLGLLREGEGLAAKVLCDTGLNLADLRQRTLDRAA